MQVTNRLLPVGCKFMPSDEELVHYYLYNKISRIPTPFVEYFVRDENLYGNKEPWVIWEQYGGRNLKDGEDLYFFTRLKKKSANGLRIDRKVGSGTWQGEDSAKVVKSRISNRPIGSKKRFRYEAKGSPENGCWIMHQFTLNDSLLPQNQHSSDFVLCRIRKNGQPDGNLDSSRKRDNRNQAEDNDQTAGKSNSRKKRKFNDNDQLQFVVTESHQFMQGNDHDQLEHSVEYRQLSVQHNPSCDLPENQEIPHDQLGQTQNHQYIASQQLPLTSDPIQWLLGNCDEKLDCEMEMAECDMILDLPSVSGKEEYDEQVQHHDQFQPFVENHQNLQYVQENQPQPLTKQCLSVENNRYMLHIQSYAEENQPLPMIEETLHDQLDHIIEENQQHPMTEQSLHSQLELSQNHQLMQQTPSCLFRAQDENQQLPMTEQNPHHDLEFSENMQHSTPSSNLEENQQLPATEQPNNIDDDDDAIYSQLTDINSSVGDNLTGIDAAVIYPQPQLVDNKFWVSDEFLFGNLKDSFSIYAA